ncbi:amino acid ABC transporter permease, partial [Klebsiella variicola]
MNNNPLFNWQDIAGILPKLLENLPVTVGITLASLLLGLMIALLIV